jgi:hypothetical protein
MTTTWATVVVYLLLGVAWWHWCAWNLMLDGDIAGCLRTLYLVVTWPVDFALIVAARLSNRD